MVRSLAYRTFQLRFLLYNIVAGFLHPAKRLSRIDTGTVSRPLSPDLGSRAAGQEMVETYLAGRYMEVSPGDTFLL